MKKKIKKIKIRKGFGKVKPVVKIHIDEKKEEDKNKCRKEVEEE